MVRFHNLFLGKVYTNAKSCGGVEGGARPLSKIKAVGTVCWLPRAGQLIPLGSKVTDSH